jgi:hypothetical protein
MAKNTDPTKIDLQWFADGDESLTLEQVKGFLVQNKDKAEVSALLSELNPVTVDSVSAFLETKEGQDLIQPYGDKRVTSAIDTYRKGKFEAEVKARVAAEILKMNPGETPEQKQIREMREEMEKDKADRERERLQGQIKELAFKEQVDPEFISGINFGSLEEAALYTKNFKAKQEELKLKVTNELLANGSYKPKSGETKVDGPNLNAMSAKEKFEYFKAEAEKREAPITG